MHGPGESHHQAQPPLAGALGPVHDSYRADIDGLRAIAIAAVVLYHAGMPVLRSGFVGVDIFFVISGFLIGRIVHREVTAGRFRFGQFCARRTRRIAPALFFVVIVTLLAGAAVLTADELRKTSLSAVSALLALSNVHFWLNVGYFTPDAGLDPLLMTWTLGVEEQFYLFLPLLLLGLWRLNPKAGLPAVLLLTIASLVGCLLVARTNLMAAFYLFPFRAWEFGVGVLLAIWMLAGKTQPRGATADAMGVAGLVGLVVSICLLDGSSWPNATILLPIAATGALILAEESIVNRRLLSLPLLVGIGLVSYSWYLWHWPIITFLKLSAVRAPSLAAMGAAAAISLVIAIGSWSYVEQPFRRGGWRTRVVLAWFPAALLGALSLPVFFLVTDGLPGRFSSNLATIDRMVEHTHTGSCAGYGATLKRICVTPAPGHPMVAIIGDSHAAALGPALQDLAAKAGWGSAILSKSSCRPLKGVTVEMKKKPRFAADCAQFMDLAFDWIRAHPEVSTIVLAGLWSGPITNPDEAYRRTDGTAEDDETGLLAEGLRQAVRYLQASGRRVFVAQDTPFWPFDPAAALKIRAIPFRSLVQHLVEPGFDMDAPTARPYSAIESVEAAIRMVAEAEGAGYLPLRERFCLGDQCRYRLGELPIFADQTHVTALGAELALAPYASLLTGDGSAQMAMPEVPAP